MSSKCTPKYRLTKRVLYLVILLLLFACKKPPSAPQPDKLIGDKAILVGTWHWIHTHHRYNWCVGPELNDTIEAGEDEYSFAMKKEGRVEFYKDGNLVDSHDIFFKHFTPLEDSGFGFAINLDGDESHFFVGRIYNDDSLLTYHFPYIVEEEEEGCEQYNNYFK